MTDYIRRLVSGNKARFKDKKLNVELDLVYVTDQLIIMGYPAAGVEGLYRNRREDAVRFLETRHGTNYWVFNFCPIKENAYDAAVFGGRVSRYPFPDHHAPPLAVMPLVAREMHAWLSGSPERVAVLHCKAGKGRSGTMACAYLLSLKDEAVPPQLERSYNAKTWAELRMRDAVSALPDPEAHDTAKTPSFSAVAGHTDLRSDTEGVLDGDKGGPPQASNSISSANTERSFTYTLKGVLDLHTAQRMKPPGEDGKVKQGVSIPSQRRFLWYWALLLAHEAPTHLWGAQPSPPLSARPKVRLTRLTLRMCEQSSLRLGIVKAANMLIERTSLAKRPNSDPENGNGKKAKGSASQVWASLARYDDRLVDLLEQWEVYTRDTDGDMGRRRRGSEHMPSGESTEEAVLHKIFDSGKWDKRKMVRSFARLGAVESTKENVVDDKGEKIEVHTLTPLSDKRWEGLKHDIEKELAEDKRAQPETKHELQQNAEAIGTPPSDVDSMNDITTQAAPSPTSPLEGIILDAGREIRIKLCIGQVFIGWFWFIPTFHMFQPPPTSGNASSHPSNATSTTTTLTLTRGELDFALGVGRAIVDVAIDMEWVVLTKEAARTSIEPPVRHRSGSGESGVGVEVEPAPSGATGAVLALVGGGAADGKEISGLREAVEARQGANN